jgi:hypothetical protein
MYEKTNSINKHFCFDGAKVRTIPRPRKSFQRTPPFLQRKRTDSQNAASPLFRFSFFYNGP